MGKEKSKKGRKHKVNISLFLSIVAILVSMGQLIFDNPYFLKNFNKVELTATELGISKEPASDKIESSFIVENIGRNTAQDVEIQLRVLKDSKVIIMPNTFTLENPSVPETPVKNLIYKCDAVVPGEKIRIYVLSDFEDYLNINKLDTLMYNTRTAKPLFDYGPYISSAKHSKGKVENSSLVFLNLNKKEVIE